MTLPAATDAKSARPSASAARALRRLRLRVTVWYAGTFAIVLATLGALLFAALAHDESANLDSSLRGATQEIARATERRKQEITHGEASGVDAIDNVRIPDRQLYLFDLEGHPLAPSSADSALRALVIAAAAKGSASGEWDAPADLTLKAHAMRFATSDGSQYVAAAVVNRDTIDDRYETLLSLAGAMGALAIILVASGGWLLAGKSVAPVERSMEQMRRFMADAAHELRTPVAVLRSRVDVTLEHPRDAATYETALGELRGEVERITTLVNDLFTLARADADERAFTPAKVQLDEIVLEAVTTAGWIAARRAIGLTVVESEEAIIDGDAALLRQLTLILLDNAIKFSRDGGVVTISVRADADTATLVIADNGVGIAEPDIPHVFERFYRAESARGSTSGAGLGLAIAKWIADAHGARIVIESVREGGTRATVRFGLAVRTQG
ncbi:MAG TPA: HAMP domain-containing sensor histidine kinase [Gemmatimonadaceae bacterium]|nr:HAMP domain-containing sensor histidine kinase [Gemmatimonadaceae bacterium]